MIATSLVWFLRKTNVRDLQKFYTPKVPCEVLFTMYKKVKECRKYGIFGYLTFHEDQPKSLGQVSEKSGVTNDNTAEPSGAPPVKRSVPKEAIPEGKLCSTILVKLLILKFHFSIPFKLTKYSTS